ncbi:MAG: SHOCT domain-containing protein [Pseudonocardiaceae bacterium]
MIDNGDGTASYRKPATLSQAFRVRISDIRGFSVTKSSKMLERTLRITGNGTELASVSMNHGVAEKIEAWVRAHPDFHTTALAQPTSAPASHLGNRLIADELIKLAQLRDSGVLTEVEFGQQKAKRLA